MLEVLLALRRWTEVTLPMASITGAWTGPAVEPLMVLAWSRPRTPPAPCQSRRANGRLPRSGPQTQLTACAGLPPRGRPWVAPTAGMSLTLSTMFQSSYT